MVLISIHPKSKLDEGPIFLRKGEAKRAGVDYIEEVISYRSNGAVMRKSRDIWCDGVVSTWTTWKHGDPTRRRWTKAERAFHINLMGGYFGGRVIWDGTKPKTVYGG